MGLLEAVLLLGGAAAVYFLNQKNAAGHLIFYPNAISSMGFDGATATILIQNTSNTQFNITSLAGNVFADGILVGNIANFTPVLVQANSQTPLPLTISFLPLGIVSSLIDAFQNGHINKNLVIDGSVNANGAQVPIKLTYSIGF